MQQLVSGLRGSSITKVAGIGFLILVLLIPVAMTRGVVSDRIGFASEARQDIMRSWGGSQIIGGPILVIPYRISPKNYYEKRSEKGGYIYILPEELSIDAVLEPGVRSRGLHDVPVYTANTVMRGAFAAPDITGLGIDNLLIDMNRAYFALSITDAKAVRNTPAISINNQLAPFEAGGIQISGFHPQIVASASELLDADAQRTGFTFSISLDVSGTDQLRYLPLADSNSVSIHSTWDSPTFIGGHLPETRDVRADGFDATWRISNLGRDLPSRWTSESYQYQQAERSSFGVGLFVPVGMYQLADRATKYAVLIIGLTFVGYFLFEVISRLHLHPLQYLLVGLANTLFYLLLLSFSEHIGFGWAYLVSAAASTMLIGGYSGSILGSRRRAAVIVGMLAGLYGFLYLTLNAENYALLAGSLGLWVILGLVMYLTRGIDWHKWGNESTIDQDDNQTEMFVGQSG